MCIDTHKNSEKENNRENSSECVSKSLIEKPTRRLRDRKQFEDEDEILWLEESGLMLYGATLMHIPKGQQPPQMYVND